MTETEDAVDNLNIKCETNVFSLYQVGIKTTVNLNILAVINRLQAPWNLMMHENGSVFFEISIDTAVTSKGLLALFCRSA
jgi:hypothetical protein